MVGHAVGEAIGAGAPDDGPPWRWPAASSPGCGPAGPAALRRGARLFHPQPAAALLAGGRGRRSGPRHRNRGDAARSRWWPPSPPAASPASAPARPGATRPRRAAPGVCCSGRSAIWRHHPEKCLAVAERLGRGHPGGGHRLAAGIARRAGAPVRRAGAGTGGRRSAGGRRIGMPPRAALLAALPGGAGRERIRFHARRRLVSLAARMRAGSWRRCAAGAGFPGRSIAALARRGLPAGSARACRGSRGAGLAGGGRASRKAGTTRPWTLTPPGRTRSDGRGPVLRRREFCRSGRADIICSVS